MTTTKAIAQVPMPEYKIHTVRTLFRDTNMSEREFRALTGDIRIHAANELDVSGFVPLEEQDPDALRRFLDEVKKSNPRIAKRYPYFWPVLAHLDLYLNGRRRSHFSRRPHDTTKLLPPPKPLSPVPIHLRFARSAKTGRSLKEITEAGLVRLPRVPRSTPRRARRNGPFMKRSFKRDPTVMEVVENVAHPVNSASPAAACSAGIFNAPVIFLRSFGSSIGGIFANIV